MREGSRLQADSNAGQVIEGAVRAAPSLAMSSEWTLQHLTVQ
jgi:hypothetical protein